MEEGAVPTGFQQIPVTPTQETDPAADPKQMTDAFTVQQRQERFDAARARIGRCLDRIVHYAH